MTELRVEEMKGTNTEYVSMVCNCWLALLFISLFILIIKQSLPSCIHMGIYQSFSACLSAYFCGLTSDFDNFQACECTDYDFMDFQYSPSREYKTACPVQ